MQRILAIQTAGFSCKLIPKSGVWKFLYLSRDKNMNLMTCADPEGGTGGLDPRMYELVRMKFYLSQRTDNAHIN